MPGTGRRRRSILAIAGDLIQTAVKNGAKGIQGIGADVFVLSEAVQLPGTDLVIPDQFVLRDPLFPHGFP